MSGSFATYKSRADLEKLLTDGLVESLQVEFKASEALAREGSYHAAALRHADVSSGK